MTTPDQKTTIVDPRVLDRELAREADRERDGYYVSSSAFPAWMQRQIEMYADPSPLEDPDLQGREIGEADLELVEVTASAAGEQLDLFAAS